jgi:tRNA dimethylallyltransferase
VPFAVNVFSSCYTILGPTATGKTRLAVALSARVNGEVVSADSRQVYRGMNIGTGKDLSDYTIDGLPIPYHLIDMVEAGCEYNVFQYQQAATRAIREIQSRGKTVILCGGSGLYIEALLKGYKLFPVPENYALRKRWQNIPDEELAQELARFRPLHNKTDTETRERLLRALEIEHYYETHGELQVTAAPVPSLIFGVRGQRDRIRERITLRLKERLNNGMIDEVKQLLQQGVPSHQLIRYGLEYKFITLYLQGVLDYETLFKQLNTAIHQFSKRQMTWFRKMERDGFEIHWIEESWSVEKQLQYIEQIRALSLQTNDI